MKCLSLFFLLLCSCEITTTGIDPEQITYFKLTFTETIPRYTQVYGLTPRKQPLSSLSKQRDEQGREYYRLPMSTQNDTVRYVLKSLPTNSDTLAIAYKGILVNDKDNRVLVGKIQDARIVYALTTFAPNVLTLTGTNLLLTE